MKPQAINAAETNFAIAEALASSRRGTFTGLIVRKKGSLRGRGADRKLYGDDVVHVVLVTGFDYPSLVQRSLAALNDLDIHVLVREAEQQGLKGWEGKGKDRIERAIHSDDIFRALVQQRDSFHRTLEGFSTSSTDHVFETLRVDDRPVRGSRVYVGAPRQPKHPEEETPEFGAIYLQGLKIAERVLWSAPNGPVPPPKSGTVKVAKNLILAHLPIGRYVQYVLKHGDDFILRVGGSAHLAASEDGIAVRESTIEDIFGHVA